jgi:dienelactone hydrolase
MISEELLAYRDADTELTGTVLRPSAAPRAAVAVFPTIMNPTPAVTAKARALAEVGYLVMVADFYGRHPGDFAEANSLSDALRCEPAVYRARLHAALTALRSVAADLPMLAIGFCMGGQAVLELARDGADLKAVVSFHGLLDTGAPAVSGAVKARILVCHGDADPLVPRETVIAFWEEMDRAGAQWHFHSYAGVKHGFTNPNPPPDNSAVDYNASADRQSWQAALALFDEVLGSFPGIGPD